jgi:hypothetical protein
MLSCYAEVVLERYLPPRFQDDFEGKFRSAEARPVRTTVSEGCCAESGLLTDPRRDAERFRAKLAMRRRVIGASLGNLPGHDGPNFVDFAIDQNPNKSGVTEIHNVERPSDPDLARIMRSPLRGLRGIKYRAAA